MKRILFLFLMCGACAFFAGEIRLAANGKANAGIVIAPNASPTVRFAAAELKRCLDKMTGADFVIGTRPESPVNFYLGTRGADGFQADEFMIAAKGSRIDIYGKDSPNEFNLFRLFYDEPDKGTLRGVYSFLDRLGVRWPAPGAESIPVTGNLNIAETNLHFKPVFADRQISGAWDFLKVYPDAKEYVSNVKEFFLWGLRNGVSTRNMVPGAHSERALGLYQNPEWLAHPERHQLRRDGSRNPIYSCWMDPGTKSAWLRAAEAYFDGKTPKEAGFELKPYLYSKWPFPFISPDEFMIDPMDHDWSNDGRCYCPRCEAFRAAHPCSDDTELIWTVIAEIAGRIQKKYPGKYISTLAYPPKKQLPQLVKVPDNVRVRLCLSGPKEMNAPKRLAADLALLAEWSKLLGRNNLPLWCYQCVSFARVLPGVPDTYPHLIAGYIEKIKPLAAGMYLETLAPTHTFRNLDVYIFMRMMWDPSRNIDKELTGYFDAYYGPAAREAQTLFARLENNWNALSKAVFTDDLRNGTLGLGDGKDKAKIQKTVWSRIYTRQEMERIDRMVAAVEKAAGQDPVYSKRARLLRTYLYDVMMAERREVMAKDDIRTGLKINAARTDSPNFPDEAVWKTVKKYHLISATRLSPRLDAGGYFQVLASVDTIYVNAFLDEPAMPQSGTDPAHQSGSPDLWKDNCAELFFHSPKSNQFWQIIINDNNAWSSKAQKRIKSQWLQIPGMHVATVRYSNGWGLRASIPRSALEEDGGELRFNFCRERNIKGRKTEYSTWSPLAMLGNWHVPENYGVLDFNNGEESHNE